MNITDHFNPYGYAMKLRRFLYKKGILRSVNVSVPVISIGNLSTGGTGKTPVTLFIAKYIIKNLNKRVAIVLRGYKRKSTGLLIVSDGISVKEDVMKSGDEAQLYAQEFPGAIVLCDEDRVRGSQKAIQLGAEVILLDDGFQHLRIKRDLNILLIDSQVGIPPVIPFGKGRELLSALSDADIIVQTNYSDNQDFFNSGNKPLIAVSTYISAITLYAGDEKIDAMPEVFSGKKILALSGIAHPEKFERSLADLSSEVKTYRLADHTEYNPALLNKIAMCAIEEKCDFIATTTKDAVKLLVHYRSMQITDQVLPVLAVIHSAITFIYGKEILINKINNLFKTPS